MNQRIRELAEQAARYSATMFLPTGENGNALFVEKFAELIVLEATVIVYDLLEDNTGAEVVVRVKEHFGVE